MKKLVFLFVLLTPKFLFAQPTIDYTVSSNEYGTGNAFNYSSGTPTWYMTWSATYLYVALIGATEGNGAVLYFDFDVNDNPISGNGSNVGIAHHNMTPDLPFNADAHFYCHNGYRKLATFSSGWNDVHTPGSRGLSSSGTDDYANGDYSSNSVYSGSREFRIKWSDLTGSGKPDSFLVTGFINYTTGIYGQIPVENVTGNQGNPSTPDYERYFHVPSNSANPGTNPLANNSFTQANSSPLSFGSISVYNFTMARNGKTITKSSTSTWTIAGNLLVADGTIDGSNVSGQHISVAGDVKISTGATMKMSTSTSDLFIKGDFTNNGTFTPNGSIVEFEGSGDQVISGSLNTSSGADNHFNQLTIDKTSGTLDLGTDIYMKYNATYSSGKFDFKNGLIELEAYDVTIGDDIPISNNSASKYFKTNGSGELKIASIGSGGNRTGTVEFPVGNSSYNPISILNSSTENDLSVNLSDFVSVDGTSGGTGVTSNAVQRTWDVKSDGSGFNLTLTANWLGTQELASFDASNCWLAHYTGSAWSPATAAANGTNGSFKTISRSGITTLGSFSPGSGPPLPVTLLDFSANLNLNNQAELAWSTASELNASHFNIHRSLDGVEKTKIGEVNAAGNSNEVLKYNYLDVKPISARTLYFLEQVDFDGRTEWFGPAVVNQNSKANNIVYFNQDKTAITLELNKAVEAEKITVMLINNVGRSVVNKVIPINGKSVEIKLPKMASGVYQLITEMGDQLTAQKLFY